MGAEDDASTLTFSVHQDLLTKRSEFFKCATSGSWRESAENTIVFPEDNLDAFKVYLHLVYTNEIVSDEIKKAEIVSDEITKAEWLLLCRLYVLAEKLQDTAAKHSAIDAMRKHGEENAWRPGMKLWDPAAINELYLGTPDRSPARRLVVDLYALLGKSDWLECRLSKLPKAFLYDIALSMIEYPRRTLGGNVPTLALEYREEKAENVKLISFHSGGKAACRGLFAPTESKASPFTSSIGLFGTNTTKSGGIFGK